jgi:hypothetical protein
MPSDNEPETPVVSRRVIKLSRRKDTNTKTNDTTNQEQSNTHSTPAKSPRIKTLNISKILGKLKQSGSLSGYSTNSSFNNTVENYGIKTQSLFDLDNENFIDNDNGNNDEIENENDDELFPKLQIQKKLKKLKQENQTKQKKKLDNSMAKKYIDPNILLPSSSPEKQEEQIQIQIQEAEKIIPTIPKKRGRPKRKIEEQKISNSKPKPKPKSKSKSKSKSLLKQTDKPKVTPEPEKKEKVEPKRKPTNRSKSNKGKEPHSSVSLFEVLEFNDDHEISKYNNSNNNPENDEDNDDEIFVLDSPVKKKPRRAKRIALSPPPSPVSPPINDEIENIKRLEEIRRNAHEGKEQFKKQRDEQKNAKRIAMEKELQSKKENQRKNQLKRRRRQEKLAKLEKLKEFTANIITNNNNNDNNDNKEEDLKVETLLIPLKDEESGANNNVKLRRSSLALRGKRLSSIGNGFIATPHDDIPTNELYKHIDSSLPDSHKLKQLLVWISKRLIKQRDWNTGIFAQQNGDENDAQDGDEDDYEDDYKDDEIKKKSSVLCKAVLEEFVDNLVKGRIAVDWWGDQHVQHINNNNGIANTTDMPIIVKQNKENVENAIKLEFYEDEVKKLQRENKIWEELKQKHNSDDANLIHRALIDESTIKLESTDFPAKEIDDSIEKVTFAHTRVQKLDRLVYRSQVSSAAIQRVMQHKLGVIASALNEQAVCDSLSILSGMKKFVE